MSLGRMRNDKGKRGEREVVQLLQPVVNEVYSAHALDVPTLQRNKMQSQFGGHDIVGLEWLSLEVKFHSSITPGKLTQWWHQTLEQAGQHLHPVLIYRQNGGAWKVMMRGTLHSPGCARGLSAAVTVDIDTFLLWFRIHLNHFLGLLGER